MLRGAQPSAWAPRLSWAITRLRDHPLTRRVAGAGPRLPARRLAKVVIGYGLLLETKDHVQHDVQTVSWICVAWVCWGLLSVASHPAPGSVCVISRDVESDSRRENGTVKIGDRRGQAPGAVRCRATLACARRDETVVNARDWPRRRRVRRHVQSTGAGTTNPAAGA